MKIFSILVIMLLWFGIVITQNAIQHNDQMKEIQELKILIEKRTLKDSLYLEHMKECAFISREDIGVGHQGYLYSKYFRNNIK